MIISVPLVLLLTAFTLLLLRGRNLGFCNALICVLLGFCLATTPLGPDIYDGLVSATEIISRFSK